MSSWLERLRHLAADSLVRPASGEKDPDADGAELASLAELGRRTARTVGKLEARLEGVETELSRLVAQGECHGDELFLPLMDALDALDAARAALASGHHDGAETGLAAIQERLGGVLSRAGYVRHVALGTPVDGRLQRVVGAEPDARLPNHSVARVVRAAVTRSEKVVRSGEVIAVQNIGVPNVETAQSSRASDQVPDDLGSGVKHGSHRY